MRGGIADLDCRIFKCHLSASRFGVLPAMNHSEASNMSGVEYVDVKGLAALTGVSVSSWNKRRLTGDTPPFCKVGRSVRYHVPTVKTWMAEREHRSTSETPPIAA